MIFISCLFSFSLFVQPLFQQTDVTSQTDVRDAHLELCDVTGKTIFSTALTSHNTTIPRGEIAPGIYFHSIRNTDGILSTGKLIAE